MANQNPVSINVFCCYAHRDEDDRRELKKHLSLLKRKGILNHWDDREISPGKEWQGEISKNLEEAQIILLLISADFLASDYCYDVEMNRALEKHRDGEARVIPIIVRAVDFKDAPFAKLQALPQDAIPIKSWTDKDEAWSNVAKGIRLVCEELRKISENKPNLQQKPQTYTKNLENQTEDGMREVKNLMSSLIPDFQEKFADNFYEKLINEIRDENIFKLKTVRALVFGRTGAGKTTTINSFLDYVIFPTTGELSCTKSLSCGQHRDGLIFYDSPGLDDLESAENVTRSALLLKQLDDEQVDKIRLIDITSNNSEGLSEFREVPYEEFKDEIKAEYYIKHKNEIVVKEFVLGDFQEWISNNKFDFFIYVMSSNPGAGLLKGQLKFLNDFYNKGQDIKLFKVLNAFDGKQEKDPTIQTQLDFAKNRLKEAKIPDADKWFVVNSKNGYGLDKLIQAFAETPFPVHVLKQLNEVVKENYSHLIQQEIKKRFLDYIANVACLVAVFPVDYSVEGKNLLSFAIKSLMVMAEYMFGNTNAKVSTNALDGIIAELQSRKYKTSYIKYASQEKIQTGNSFIDWWRDVFDSAKYSEETTYLPSYDYVGIGGVDAIELTIAVGLALHTLHNLTNIVKVNETQLREEIVSNKRNIQNRWRIIDRLKVAGRWDSKRLIIAKEIYEDVRNSLN